MYHILINQLNTMRHLYDSDDISLTEWRYSLILAAKLLKEELDKQDINVQDFDLLLDTDCMAILCCYKEDLNRIYTFLVKAITILSPKIEDETTDVPLEALSVSDTDMSDIQMLSEKEVGEIFEKISNVSPNNDKLAWRRLYKELQRHIIEYNNLNSQFLEVKAKRVAVNKTINEMREKMVNECIHPKTELVYKGDHVVCKFCEKRLKLV